MKLNTGKFGRPTKYTNNTIHYVQDYISRCYEGNKLPTVEGLAIDLGVGTRTLYDWQDAHIDFSQTMDTLRDTQKYLLIKNGLNSTYSSQFSMFLLKAIHGLSDKKPEYQASQNNYMNVSPDVVAEALKIMENSKT